MNTTKIIAQIKVGLVAILIFAGAAYVSAAWNNPGANPPNDNAAAPINVSSVSQDKAGGLGIGNGLVVDGVVEFNKVPGQVYDFKVNGGSVFFERIRIDAGNPGTNKVLVSTNDDGNAEWKSLSEIGGDSSGGGFPVVQYNSVNMEFNGPARTNNYGKTIMVTAQVRANRDDWAFLDIRAPGGSWQELYWFEAQGGGGLRYVQPHTFMLNDGWSYRYRHTDRNGNQKDVQRGQVLRNIFEIVPQ